jgi:hypothetical protein
MFNGFNYDIKIMKFRYTKSLLFGTALGIYFAEKRLPFPIQYMPKANQVGDIKIDLSFVNSLVSDCKKILPTSTTPKV